MSRTLLTLLLITAGCLPGCCNKARQPQDVPMASGEEFVKSDQMLNELLKTRLRVITFLDVPTLRPPAFEKLRSRYGVTSGGNPPVEVLTRFMTEWNPLGMQREELEAVVGPPTHVNEQEGGREVHLHYGEPAVWRFVTRDFRQIEEVE